MYSDESIYRWTQTGIRQDTATKTPGNLTFYSKYDEVLLSLDLHPQNRLYFYGLSAVDGAVNATQNDAACLTVNTGADEQSPEARREQGATPQRTPARKAPVTLGYQLDSELWSVRLGSPGEASMHALARGKALGIPNEF